MNLSHKPCNYIIVFKWLKINVNQKLTYGVRYWLAFVSSRGVIKTEKDESNCFIN